MARGSKALDEGTAPVQSVDRALSILGFLASEGELGVTEIAELLGVHKSTAFRLIATLETHGLVQQMERNSRYRLGVGLLRLASATRGQLEIVQESRPYLKELADEIGETANIVVLAGAETLYLDQAIGTSALQMYNWVGRRNPPHATANGRVLLAGMPAVEREALLTSLVGADGRLPRLTTQTVTDPAELTRILAEVSAAGFAIVTDELEDGLTAIAAPVFGGDGTVLASISVSGPTFRMPADLTSAASRRVVEAAFGLSGRMGYQRPLNARS